MMLVDAEKQCVFMSFCSKGDVDDVDKLLNKRMYSNPRVLFAEGNLAQ